MAPVLRRSPALRVSLSEGGIGWIPYFLERIVTCFIDDPGDVEQRHRVGLDTISHVNALRHFRYDPFAFRPKEHATIGALRVEADLIATASQRPA